MIGVLDGRFRAGGLSAVLLAALAVVAAPPALEADEEEVSIEGYVDPALQPLTAREVRQALTALQSDRMAPMALARGQRIQTVSVERHEEDKNAPPGQRRADVVLYNYDTDETLTAVVALGPRSVVEELEVVPGQPPALAPQEVERAQQLALADPVVQAELRAAGLDGRESELFITHLLAHPAEPSDPCWSHRCVMLFLNTPDAVLPIEPIVDLTIGEVEVQQR
jgi:Cu2+-containing amine oxidase